MTDLSLKLVRALAKGLSKGRATHVFWGEVASEEGLKGGIVSFFSVGNFEGLRVL